MIEPLAPVHVRIAAPTFVLAPATMSVTARCAGALIAKFSRLAAVAFALNGTLAVAMSDGAAHAAGPAAAYTADPQQSRLEFTGVQAGAQFKGTFHRFTAAVDFAPDAPATSHIEVQVDLASEDSMDKDRDKTILGPDIFDVAHFPTAHYVTRSIAKTAGGYSAVGALTLRGVTKDVPVDFQFTSTANGAKLEGSAKLKRLDFGAGQGDWKTTEWIADAVQVRFSLVLKPKS